MTRILIFISGCVVFGLMFVIAQPWRDWGPEPPLPPLPRPDSVPVARLDPTLPPDVAEAVRRAESLYLDGRGERALALLAPYTEDALPDVDALLGRIYLYGAVDIHDSAKAYRYLRSASDKGHGPSAYRLAWALVEGEGVERNIEQGLALLHKAAECGLPRANHALGRIYSQETIVKEDRAKGIKFSKFAAWAGMPDAQFNLAILLLRAANGSDDEFYAYQYFLDAMAWMLLAAESEDAWLIEKTQKYVEKIVQHEDYDYILEEKRRREDAILPADPYQCGFTHPLIQKN